MNKGIFAAVIAVIAIAAVSALASDSGGEYQIIKNIEKEEIAYKDSSGNIYNISNLSN